MKITVEIDNQAYIIDTEIAPHALNPKQIEILMNILDIPYKNIEKPVNLTGSYFSSSS